LTVGGIPKEPWCDNWKEILMNPEMAPVNIRPSFLKKSKWEMKRQAKTVINQPLSALDDESSQFDTEEQKLSDKVNYLMRDDHCPEDASPSFEMGKTFLGKR
jgi:hypothetical protein